MYLGEPSLFTIRADETMIVRAGKQTNCGGIAQIHIRIVDNLSGVFTFEPDIAVICPGDPYGERVRGCAVPKEFRKGIFKAAHFAFEYWNQEIGIHFELIDALVHIVDARVHRFEEAGFFAMKGWIEKNLPGSWKDPPENL